jgi:hypothetical protein
MQEQDPRRSFLSLQALAFALAKGNKSTAFFGKIKINIAAIPKISGYIIILIQNAISNQLALSCHQSLEIPLPSASL